MEGGCGAESPGRIRNAADREGSIEPVAADVVDLIDDVEQRIPQAERDRRTRAFMLEACGRVVPHLPPQSAEWMRIARAYATGAASEKELTEGRQAAWTFLQGRSCAFEIPEVSAVRAVLFVLYPDGDDDWLFGMTCFLEFCIHAGADSGTLYRLVRDTFPGPDAAPAPAALTRRIDGGVRRGGVSRG